MCSSLRGAERDIEERTLRLDNNCYRCIAQLQFLKEIQHVMDDGHRELEERTLRMLVEKLTVAKSLLRSLVSAQPTTGDGRVDVRFVPKPITYALKKDRLDEAIDSLETWQRLSDPSWFLIFRMNDRRLDNVLAQSGIDTPLPIPSIASIRANSCQSTSTRKSVSGLALPPDALHKMDVSNIPLSNCKVTKSIRSDKTINYILQGIKSTQSDIYRGIKKNMRDLASRLQHDDPQNFGLLNCKGFIADVNGPQANFIMVFRTPPGLTNPRSLRDLLLNAGEPSSLSHKFLIAQELAKAVAYVHIFGFVHKCLRPEAVLGFESPTKDSPSIFLVGFEEFRKEEGRTRRLGDNAVEKNLYRHPSRQGANPSNDFIMQHDIYSLGVCLLEVGLWKSFIEYDTQNENPTLSSLLGVSPDISKEMRAQFLFTSAKDKFIKLSRTRLRKCMGTRYSDIVETCLTCLDPDNNGFGDESEFEDEDGILVGVRYIEKASATVKQTENP